MDKEQGRRIIREYAKELGVVALGEEFISDGERGEGPDDFWEENFGTIDQVKDAFYDDYYHGSDYDDSDDTEEMVSE
ncbi:MAG TPA: hypothetical protein VFQ26_08145 [Nitrospiraceae bacterium]|nr:hypothetical protein [Nitrospiraceae bacterium]